MERSSQSNEQEPPARPRIDIDLSGPDSHWFNLISRARAVLEGDALKDFNRAMWEAIQHGSDKTYADILAIVKSYMDLTDTSGIYKEYMPRQPEA